MEQSKIQQIKNIFSIMRDHSLTLQDLLLFLLLERKQELLNLISTSIDENNKNQYKAELEEVRTQLLSYGA